MRKRVFACRPGRTSTVSPRTRKLAARELDVIAVVLQVDQPLQELVARDLLADAQRE